MKEEVCLRLVKRVVGFVLVLCGSGPCFGDGIPVGIAEFTRLHCVKCHGSDQPKGDFRIDTLAGELTEVESREQWNLVYDFVSAGDMPPKKSSTLLDEKTRAAFLKMLHDAFAIADQKARVGGTPFRRLNRVEYLNTVRDLFGIRMIKLPLSFPDDATNAEFDTMPEGMFLSPAVMEAYHETATDIADRLVPLDGRLSDTETTQRESDEVRYAYRSDYGVEEIGGDATRRWFGPKKEFLKFIGFNNSGWSGALWDSQFIAPTSGLYRVRLLSNAQADRGADGRPLRLAFYVFDPTEEQLPKRYRRDRAARVAEVDVPPGEPVWIHCDVPIEAGETFHIYCENRFANDRFSMGALNRSEINKLVKEAKGDDAPTVELQRLQVTGPIAILPRVESFLGAYPPKLDRETLEEKLIPLATRAFRRPLSALEKKRLLGAVLAHAEQTGQSEFAWHYAIRRILCSPSFLYRETESSDVLNQYTLASRLSYFLWSTMPDDELLKLAEAGKLSSPKILEAQTRRLIADEKAQQFVKHFTGQWLGNRTVASINVCDNRYLWDDNVRYGFLRSTEMFFDEILRENLPIDTFIDSDFTYANSAMLAVWQGGDAKKLSAVAAKQRQSLVWPEPQRISLRDLPASLPDDVRLRRGVLGLPGVLTVSGDGVESSPILRGVWVLDNLFGQPPPPPPKDVPALDIDTSQATTVRETLVAHQKLETCAKCHRDIDPLGLALENYDAIGGWRTTYAGNKASINVAAVMPDGRPIEGAESIRKILLANPEVFTRCLLRKLLEYGAGRKLSVGDERVVQEIVASRPQDGYRFQDLIVEATMSTVFLAK